MNYDSEKIKPYNNTESKAQQVQQMFDSIAPAYDFMNRAMTLGLDKVWWRRRAVNILRKTHPEKILDIATGTGDLAIMIHSRIPGAKITGVDLSDGMLSIARRKVSDASIEDISFIQGDSMSLPFADNSFDAITAAYGVRNFEYLDLCYAEMYRVMRKGGTLCVIELSTPTNPLVKPFYKIYTRCLIPVVGRMISRDTRAYSYLPESIAAVPQGEKMLEIMRKAGFDDTRYITMTFGVCTIYLAKK